MIVIRPAAAVLTALVWLAATCVAGPAVAASAQPIVLEPRVMLTVQQRERLQAVANEGADALRRYLWRTRMIYGWAWSDLVGGE